MAELVTIPISVFEITIDYEQPALKIWADRAAVVQGIFDALSPWKPNVDDIEPRTTGKAPSAPRIHARQRLVKSSDLET